MPCIAECQIDFSPGPELGTVPRRRGGSSKQAIFNPWLPLP